MDFFVRLLIFFHKIWHPFVDAHREKGIENTVLTFESVGDTAKKINALSLFLKIGFYRVAI